MSRDPPRAPARATTVLVAVWLLGVGLAIPAPAQRGDVSLDSEEADTEVGAKAAAEVAAQMGLVGDDALQEYVRSVGRSLVRHAPPTGFAYRFHVVDEAEPNAFALPGGWIYVSRGLLELANSEAQLANVLGHEITHVAARHAAARQWIERHTVNPLMLPGVLLGAVLGQGVGEATSAPFRAFNAPAVAAYSRDQERSADRGGQRIAARAGYDPLAMAEFLETLEAYEREQFGRSRLPHYLDTHPGTAERAADMATDAGLLAWQPETPVAADRASYLRRLDGLLVGASAGEGVFREQRFLHPDLDFSIRFPDGWKLVNTDLAVGAISPDRRMQIFLNVPTPGDDPQAAAREFLARSAESTPLKIQGTDELVIGGQRAYRVIATVAGPQGPMASQLTWIPHGGAVYRLNAIAPAAVYRRFEGRARNTARSFRRLSPEERDSITDLRMRLIEADPGETLADVSRRSANSLDVHLTARINGVKPSTELAPGQLVKIARPEAYPGRADD